MAPQQHPTTIENLPGEVLWDILIRVPAKPLGRMRCVSKPLNRLLSQHSFMKSHLHHHRSLHNNDEILLVSTDVSLGERFSVTAHPSRSPHLQLANFIKLPPAANVRFVGSVHGLICFTFTTDPYNIKYRHWAIQIWNPTLSKTLTLPPCYVYYQEFDTIRNYFRFGFDPKTEDYKLVKLIFWAGRDFKERPHIEVYSMQKNSWELINNHGISSHAMSFFNGDTLCADGHDGRLHWLGSVIKRRKLETIIAFDLNVNTFSQITLPDFGVKDVGKSKIWNGIGVLCGKLCVMSCVEGCEFEVWVMNEYGVTESWVKHHVLSQFSTGDRGFQNPLGFTLNNEFLFTTVKDGLVLYDPIASKVKPFNIKPQCRWNIQVVRYVESLVWVTPAN